MERNHDSFNLFIFPWADSKQDRQCQIFNFFSRLCSTSPVVLNYRSCCHVNLLRKFCWHQLIKWVKWKLWKYVCRSFLRLEYLDVGQGEKLYSNLEITSKNLIVQFYSLSLNFSHWEISRRFAIFKWFIILKIGVEFG